MVRVKRAKEATELRWRRTQLAPPAPAGDALQCSFNQLHLGSPQQAKGPAPSQVARQMVWHRLPWSCHPVAPPPRSLPRSVQVQEVSSAKDEDVQILEELSQPPLATSTPPAPTLPGDITFNHQCRKQFMSRLGYVRGAEMAE